MKNSQLYSIISQLGTIEHRLLGQFVRSPYHNRRPELVVFCDLLIKSANSKDKIAESKEYYFKKLYPGKAYDDKKMRYTISFLYKLVKYFLAVEQLKTDTLRQQQIIALEFKEKKLERFEKEVLRSEQILESQPLRDAQYYFNRFQNLSGYSSNSVHLSKVGATLRKMNNSADVYFIATTLKMGCMWLTFGTVTRTDNSNKLLNQIILFIKDNQSFLEIPVIDIYYNAYQMLSQINQDQFFDNFKLSIEESGHLFKQTELSELYVLAINHCIRQANQNKEKYRKELFEIYKKGLSAEAFFDNGELGGKTYINIVQAGLNQQAYDWVAKFIEEYKTFLKLPIREQFYLFNLANYHNKSKNYDKVMEILRSVTFDETMMEMSARRMLLKIYYDMGEVEALYSLFDSFKNYIYRHKEIGYAKDNYLNLIKYAKKLLNTNPRDRKAIAKLKKEITQTQAIAEKAWLLERVKGLGQRYSN